MTTMTEAPPWTLGDGIRRARLSKGWTQVDLGRRIGTNPTVISRWEHGRRLPRIDDLTRVAEVCDADWVLDLSRFELTVGELEAANTPPPGYKRVPGWESNRFWGRQ